MLLLQKKKIFLFAILRPNIGVKNMRNAKTNNANLYSNFYPQLKPYFSVEWGNAPP